MNYWHMQLHDNKRENYTRDDIINIISNHKVIGMGEGWDNDRGQPEKFQNEVEIGDIVLIRHEGPLALVKVTSECTNNQNSNLWFDIIREIEVLEIDYNSKIKDEYHDDWKKGIFPPTTFDTAENSSFIKYWHKKVKKN